jgi:hypothetical protein
MKKLSFLFAILLTLSTNIFAQGVGINTTGADADASAILDVSSTTQGFLPPRMTEAQKDAISSPATGLLIFQTDGTSGLYYYNGSSWESFVPSTSTHYIGESYGGGIVFWVDATGQHGLIAAPSDQSTTMRWKASTSNLYTMALGDGIGAGEMNTTIIIAILVRGDGNTYAARVCADLVISNYSDWYLPSKYELNLMYQQKATIGGFSNDAYWSSTEHSNGTAWFQYFSFGLQDFASTNSTLFVRAVRAF